jgi:hypothetical protein
MYIMIVLFFCRLNILLFPRANLFAQARQVSKNSQRLVQDAFYVLDLYLLRRVIDFQFVFCVKQGS